MSKKLFDVLGIVSLLLALAPASATKMGGREFPRNNMAPPGLDPMDLSVEMLGKDEIAIRKQAAKDGRALTSDVLLNGQPAQVGDELVFNVYDYMSGSYDETFVVLLEGEHGLILIEKAAFDSFDGENYAFPDPYACGEGEHVISHEQLVHLLNEFDTNMWPVETTIFGEPLARGEKGQKVWTLIFNIRDEPYYDCTVTSYIAGYFSASTSTNENKNIMHIDSYDWANRVGPDAARPYLYEGTFAHEFEHLIHFDIDPDEPSWVDEGLADLAIYMCGYGHSDGHIAYYMVYHPITALTYWGGNIEDYGASYLFQLYLYEKFGGADFASALVQEQANGIEGIENTLAFLGYKTTFAEIFDDWTIANYIDDNRKGGGKYGYETLNIGSIDTWGYTIEYALGNFWWGPPALAPFVISSDYFGNPLPYTAHYYRYTNEDEAYAWIDGADFSGNPAFSGTFEWYSGVMNWAWRSFYQSFDIPASGGTLNFMTYYEIENDWDYAYVEVYDQATGEWYTLPATGTVDYVSVAQDNPNTPDEREPTAYEAAGCWHAFTGNSNGWKQVSMDLTPFAGHKIDLYFSTWQDGAVSEQMMYVDDISIPEINFFDDVEVGEGGWQSTGWYITDGIEPNGYGVVAIDTKWVPTARYPEPSGNNAMSLHRIKTMEVDIETQSGMLNIQVTPSDSGRVQVVAVSNHSPHGGKSYYEFGADL